MHHLLWPVCALALMTAGCDNGGAVRITTSTTSDSSGVLKVVDALQCPQTQGVLTRKGSASADGSSAYSAPRGLGKSFSDSAGENVSPSAAKAVSPAFSASRLAGATART